MLKFIIKPHDKATFWMAILTLIGVFVLSARLLDSAGKFHTSLLYIAIPYSLSLALYYLTPYKEGTSWKRRFWNNLRTNLIIILASSLLLMEGYVCVIMAMPLFILITIVAFISAYIWNTYGKGSPKSYILPAIMILASFEGTTPEFSFNRYNAVTYTQTVNLDAATIKERIQQPIKFKGNRHWLLSVFPMPVHVDTVKLKEGEIRKYDFIYHRWFITNTKVGSVEVKFREIGENRIKTEITDTSYISGYMKLHGTEFNLTPLNEHQTQVSLTVYFDRTLDPIWYYGPLERFAVQKGIKYFINEVLAEKSGENI